MNPIIDYGAMAAALLGSALLALKSPKWSRWGFVAFLVSNALWILWGLRQEAWALVVQNLGFTATSVYGVMTWFGFLKNRSDESG